MQNKHATLLSACLQAKPAQVIKNLFPQILSKGKSIYWGGIYYYFDVVANIQKWNPKQPLKVHQTYFVFHLQHIPPKSNTYTKFLALWVDVVAFLHLLSWS